MTKFRKYILPVATFLVVVSCNKKTFDINIDPNNPSVLPVSKILPTVEANLGNALAIGSGFSQELEQYVHRTTGREDADQYGAQGGNFYITNGWNTMYVSMLNNDEFIISDATSKANFRYAGVAKILKAYAYSQLVDVFGDVPFSEANQLRAPNLGPKFDKGAEIYPKLFTLLDEAIANLGTTVTTTQNLAVPGNDDVIYKGVIASWIKAANTIKLKLLTQQRKIKSVTTDVNTLETANNMISVTAESFMVPYGPLGATDDRNPGFAQYFATQRTDCISPWFYETLSGINAFMPGTGNLGNKDPRIPYYWYNQLKTADKPKEGNNTEYRNGAFVSIVFGSTGPNRDRNQQGTTTVLGVYPIGGRYDDGGGATVTANHGTGAAPYKLITYADRLYLEAELINTGVIVGDARARTLAAITESFKMVDYVVSLVNPASAKTAQTAPPVLSGSAAVTTYMNNVMAAYDLGSNAKQLEIIITQKWIQSFGSGVDAYTDKRRTGYPVVFDPNNTTMAPGGRFQPPINGDPNNPGQPSIPVQLVRPYPLSLPWPTGELTSNASAPTQKEPSTFKPFWLP
jgi:hypothetical protein